MPSGCNVRNLRVQKLSLICLWFSFQLGLWSMIQILDLPNASNECPGDTKCWFTGKSVFCRKVTSVSIHSFVEWLDTFSHVLRPTDVTVKQVNHIRCFAIDIAQYVILLSCCFTMEHLCVLQLETSLATLVTTWFMLGDRRWRATEEYKEKKDQQTGSPCSNVPFLFRENVMHRPSSLERNWKKGNAAQVVPWTTRCSVPVI